MKSGRHLVGKDKLYSASHKYKKKLLDRSPKDIVKNTKQAAMLSSKIKKK
jgi:hypothetical protein